LKTDNYEGSIPGIDFDGGSLRLVGSGAGEEPHAAGVHWRDYGQPMRQDRVTRCHDEERGSKDAASCTNYCVKMGGQYVLYDDEANTMFLLDDQDKSAAFAGQKVKVVGSYDASTKTIHNPND